MVATKRLIPENFLGASKFLSVKGVAKSPSPTVFIGPIPVGLALLSVAVSNGTIGVIVLSSCIDSRGGGVVTRDIVGYEIGRIFL